MTSKSISKCALSGLAAFALAASMVPVANIAAAEKAYAADGTVSGNQYQITSPLYVTFANDSYYDVANPQHSLEESVKFENMGTDDVFISNIECDESSDGSVRAVFTELQADGPKIEDQPLFSLWNNANKNGSLVSFNHLANDTDSAGMTYDDLGEQFIISGRSGSTVGKLDCTYRLNLTNVYEISGVNATIRDDLGLAADETTYKPFAKVKYTFRPYDFIFTYKENGKTLLKTAADLKNDALKLAATAVSSDEPDQDIYKELESSDTKLYNLYSGFVENPDSYLCKMRSQTGVWRELNIIGINHDNAADKSGKAGLTLQFKYIHDSRRMSTATSTTATFASCGWINSEVYNTYMKVGGASQVSYWNGLLSPSIQAWLVPVTKYSFHIKNADYSYPDSFCMTEDSLFLLSENEVFPDFTKTSIDQQQCFTNDRDGFTYSRYSKENSDRTKRTSATASPSEAWLRSTGTGFTASYGSNINFRYITTAGMETGAGPSNVYGLCAAFCL